MLNIRRNIFETNSSSTHALVILTDQEFNDWKNNKLYINFYNTELLPLDKAKQLYEEHKSKYNTFNDFEWEYIRGSEFMNYTIFNNMDEYEDLTQAFIKNGQKFWIVGYTGWDG